MSHKVYVNSLPSIAKEETETTDISINFDKETPTLSQNEPERNLLDGLKPTVLPKLPKDIWAVMFKYMAANKKLAEKSLSQF